MKTRKSILEKHIEATEKQIEKLKVKIAAHEAAIQEIESERDNLRHTLAFLQGKLPVKEEANVAENPNVTTAPEEVVNYPDPQEKWEGWPEPPVNKPSAFHQKLQEKAHKGDGA